LKKRTKKLSFPCTAENHSGGRKGTESLSVSFSSEKEESFLD
jgi:hypothetical protein